MEEDKIVKKEGANWTHISDHDPEREAYNAANRELKTQERAFFEKLALLDGGIVGLVVSSVFGPFHGQIKHKYTLLLGLTCLIVAMAFLLLRTYHGIRHERGVIQISYLPTRKLPEGIRESALWMHLNGFLGCVLTVVGIGLLIVEVWLLT